MKDLFRIISHRFQKNKKQSVSVLAIIITFVMVYSLIMPAVAIERDAAEKEPGLTIEESASENVAAEAMAEAEPASLEAEGSDEAAAVESAPVEEAAAAEPAAEEIEAETAAPAAAPAQGAADDSNVAADTSAAQQGNTGAAQLGASVGAASANTGAAQANTGAAQADGNNANADGKADPSDSDTNTSDAEEEMPAQKFEQVIKYKEIIDEDGNTIDKEIKVVIDAAKNTFPAGTTMKAELILDNADVEKAVEDAVKLAAGELADATSIVQYRAVDITFADKDGQKVEPAKKVEVRITSDKIVEIVNPMLVHVNVNDQNGRIINADVFPKNDVSIIDEKPDTIDDNENTMLFKASRFSPYVIVESKTIDEEGDTMHGLNGVEENADNGAEADADADGNGTSGSVADGVLIAESDNYTVTIKFDEDANLPEDAEIEINEIPEASRQYQSYMGEAEKLLVGTENGENGASASGSTAINYAKIVDVNIVSATEGTVTPDANVDVDIAYKETEEIAEGTVMQALSFNGRTPAVEEDALVYGGETYVDGMQVTTDKLPVYGIVGTETLTTDYITAEGETYKISVICGADAKIPEGATLSVTEITPEDDAFEDYLIEFENKTGNKFVQFVRFFDITILNKEGEEIQPASDVTVNIELEDKEEKEEASGKKIDIDVIHFKDGDSELLDVEDKENITFETNSFSVYGVEGSSEFDGNTVVADGPEEKLSAKAAPVLRASAAGDVPDHNKYLSDNGDGTYKLALNVTGSSTTITTSNTADIILVLDESTSMNQASGSDSDAVANANGEYFRFHYYSATDPYYYFRVDDFSTTTTGNPNQGTGQLGGVYGVQNSNLAGQDIIGNTYGRDSQQDRLLYQYLYGQRYDVETREQVMYEAVQTLADELLDGTDTVRISVVLFGSDVTRSVNWTTSSSTVMAGIDQTAPVAQATNWNGALDAAYNQLSSSRSDADKYVIFLSDGNPSGGDYGTLNSGITRATRIVNYSGTGVDFYSISTAADAQNMEALANGAGGTYFNGNNKEGLEAAFSAIITKVQNTLGVQGVKIDDGTTNTVVKTDGLKANLLDIDAGSFKYYRSGGDNNGSPKYNPSANTIDVDGETVNIGVEWTETDNPAPPAATVDENGDVHWDLSSLKVLENDVTYTVVFDVWPSQETLDYISDLKNGYIEYQDLDENIRKYLSEDYQLKTNTGATLTFTDTRTSDGEQTEDFVDPDPKRVDAAKEMAVSKEWSNTLDGNSKWKDQEIDLYVTRDGVNRNSIRLYEGHWTESTWISYGILTDHDGVITLKTTGHDYSFAEDVSVSHNWEIETATVRPMLINNHLTMLKKIEADEAPASIRNATSANAKDGNYYKLTVNGTVEYYIIDEAVTHLMATNHRRSYLDVYKTVEGNNVPAGDEFTFKLTVDTNAEGSAADTNSDYWVWFSVADANNSYSIVTDPDIATASGMRWQLNDDPDNGTVTPTKPSADTFNGYFCVPSGNEISVQMQNGYSLRFLNLPEGADYTVIEDTSTLKDGYSFIKMTSTRSYDADGERTQPEQTHDNDWTTVNIAETTNPTISGSIDYTESAYSVGVTNKWETIDLQLKKVDDQGETLGGSTFELRTGTGWTDLIGTYQPGGESTIVDDETGDESTIQNPNPIDLGSLGIGLYMLSETGAPSGYVITNKDVYFKIDKENNQLVSYLTDENGNRKGSTEGIDFTSEMIDGVLTYTISVTNTPGTALPNTGGSGTLPYTLGGIALIMASALMYGFRMRRRERGLN